MSSRPASGFTLVEMIIAIVIISVGLTGVMIAFNTVVGSSSDPLIHKQMLAVAEEMMEEILLKPFTPQGVAPANGVTACGAGAARAGFDDVADYNNYQTTGVCDIDGTAVGGLADYNVSVTVAAQADLGLTAADVRRVTVIVKHGSETITLVGWRTSYAT
ncbi:MAG: prepilin-type N-terminal cleavage/methylation domain-containing protein [Rhodocyclaceae bacterium]|nr:prepilin-type N-terminal cleavage/methylation domain-containing protein [Rhodocyclaceae bacterium]